MNKKDCKMAYGDRVYACLSIRGKKILEFMIERVANMTELLGELRAHTRKFSGLCRLYVRNMSRGWSMERPLMLYPETYPVGDSWRERQFEEKPSEPVNKILNPWDTH